MDFYKNLFPRSNDVDGYRKQIPRLNDVDFYRVKRTSQKQEFRRSVMDFSACRFDFCSPLRREEMRANS